MPGKLPLTTIRVILSHIDHTVSGWYWRIADVQICMFLVSGRFFGRYHRWRVDSILATPRNRALADVEKGLIASLRKAISAQLGGAEVSGLTLDKIEWKEE